MWKWITAALFIVVGMSLQACAPKSQDDCGFVQNVYGERISWKGTLPITLYVHPSAAEYMETIKTAASVWEQTAGRKLFNIVAAENSSSPIDPHKDGFNVIYLMNTWESDKSSEQARTSVYWVGDQIKEADIRLNGSGQFKFYTNQLTSKDAVNMEALVIHEMGHVLGLKHKDTGGSVMATYLPSATERVHLASTDEASLQCEY